MPETKKEIISKLQKDILLWQGFKPVTAETNSTFGLGDIEAAFPNGVFPTGAIHEFVCPLPEQAAASGGFIGGLLATLMRQGGACLWISRSRHLFPPALKTFGIEPDRIVFIDLNRERDVLWVMEEGLKCEGLAAVIAEVGEINITQSRRLQLAVEQSRVTGFVIRNDARKLGTTACVARWQVRPLPSESPDGLPGIGFPHWQVDLLKVRNGNPGSWKVKWLAGEFIQTDKQVFEVIPTILRRIAG